MSLKSMDYKKSALCVGNKKYIYTVSAKAYIIKIIVYLPDKKTPYFITYVTYAENWGFDAYRPKTIEILIRFYNEYKDMIANHEFRIKDYPVLFQRLIDTYFEDSASEEIDEFKKICYEQLSQ